MKWFTYEWEVNKNKNKQSLIKANKVQQRKLKKTKV